VPVPAPVLSQNSETRRRGQWYNRQTERTVSSDEYRPGAGLQQQSDRVHVSVEL